LRVVFFTKYTRAGASSRYRSFQYAPALAALGIEAVFEPLFDDDYLLQKYASGRVNLGRVVLALLHRVIKVFAVPRGATVVVEYELLPWFPAWPERWLHWRGVRVLMDYDDALFHQYDAHPSFLVRAMLGRKIATVMQLAQTVIAGNDYLATYARQAGASRVVVIPTVVDISLYAASLVPLATKKFTIGWIGSPSTARYLLAVAPVLAKVCAKGEAVVRLIGAGKIELPGVPVESVAWSEATEVDEISRFDVGIMPLPDEPWARGKCGFKLIQYMACEVPVIASPVGVNQTLVEHDKNGLLADSLADWEQSLLGMMQDLEYRKRMGRQGRRKVQQAYDVNVTAPKLAELLRHESMA